MATSENQALCETCSRTVLGRKTTPNHLLHFLVAFFTCGLWVIPWFGLTLAASFRPYLCPTCGNACKTSMATSDAVALGLIAGLGLIASAAAVAACFLVGR